MPSVTQDIASRDARLGEMRTVKMVIWDLDETFWHGTLSEGPIQIRESHIDIVKTLAMRGIVSSICSKNEASAVQVVLEQAGMWEFFVFPHIAFEPKGEAVRQLIGRANLRPENVLFIDDNLLNLAEARHFSPGLMTFHPDDILSQLASLPQLRGKPDPGLSRLGHYKVLEKRERDQSCQSLSNEDFLRSSGITILLDYDVESVFERIVELANRSNQLNYTKSRFETEHQVAGFRAQLASFGAQAAAISVRDIYGEYGIAGFYLIMNTDGAAKIVHFVFSCRVMNMGIEQYMWERLNRPAIDVIGPVSTSLTNFDHVDWVAEETSGQFSRLSESKEKLTLIGGCDLLQVASYCSPNRAEYVNDIREGVIRNYDDIGFILSNRDSMDKSAKLPLIPCWDAERARRLDSDLSDSSLIIVSLWDSLFGQYIVPDEGVFIRASIGQNTLAEYIRNNPLNDALKGCDFVELTLSQKATLIRAAMETIAAQSPQANARIILGRNVSSSPHGRDLRRFYNRVCQKVCKETGSFVYLDIDVIVPPTEVIDGTHFTRQGYFAVAEEIGRLASATGSMKLLGAGVEDASTARAERTLGKSIFRRHGRPHNPALGTVLRLPTKISGGLINI